MIIWVRFKRPHNRMNSKGVAWNHLLCKVMSWVETNPSCKSKCNWKHERKVLAWNQPLRKKWSGIKTPHHTHSDFDMKGTVETTSFMKEYGVSWNDTICITCNFHDKSRKWPLHIQICQISCNFVVELKLYPRHIEIKKKRYAHLVSWKPEKLSSVYKRIA